MDLIIFAIYFVAYLLASRLAMRWLGGGWRDLVLAWINLLGVYFILIEPASAHAAPMFVLYVLLAVAQYIMFRLFSGANHGWQWVAFFTPLLVLIGFRYIPAPAFIALGQKLGIHLRGPPVMLGLSYLAFRCSRLVLEVQNGSVKRPGLWQYLGFAFFLPTMSLGPINNYANFRSGFEAAAVKVPVSQACFRILVGLVKYEFLGCLLNQMTYSEYLLNGHPHSWTALPLVMIIYFLYLYCNFSGFCDMAIGASALIGIPVPENFNNPLAARNMKEFWNRWHITLSQWMRDIVFVPLSKSLVRIMGPARVNHAIALAIFVVFLLVGIWHGAGWNFAIFGLLQALGVVANHYYGIALKHRLGREGFKAYMANRWIAAAGVLVTFLYYAATLFFFANTLTQIKEIIQSLR